jgi:hypothetical protein
MQQIFTIFTYMDWMLVIILPNIADFFTCSSDTGQREQEKAQLEKQFQESDQRLDGLIAG